MVRLLLRLRGGAKSKSASDDLQKLRKHLASKGVPDEALDERIAQVQQVVYSRTNLCSASKPGPLATVKVCSSSAACVWLLLRSCGITIEISKKHVDDWSAAQQNAVRYAWQSIAGLQKATLGS